MIKRRRIVPRMSPDEMHPLDDIGQRKGMGEVHDTRANAGDLLVGSSTSEQGESVGSSPRNPSRENRRECGSTGSTRTGSSSDSSTARGSGSNSQFGSSDEGVGRATRNT